MATKRIPNADFVHRVLMNIVERKFDSCYRFRDIVDISDNSRLNYGEPSLGDMGFRESGLMDPLRDRDRLRDYEYERERERERLRDSLSPDYPIPKDKYERQRSIGPVYTPL